jgi:3',5'-cyclic-AMP phosphodiesterase
MESNVATQADFRLVHFTDTHIMAGALYAPRTGQWQWDTAASLRRVIGVINALEPRPAFAVVGGDLVSPDLIDRHKVLSPEEYEPSYRLLQDILGTLSCPTYLLIGNHDNRTAFHRIMGTDVSTPEASHYYSFDYQGYHFIALDSQAPGNVWGHLDTAQLAWLRDNIEAHRAQPTVVFVHHHPWPLGIAWLDTLHLRNGNALLELLHHYANVRWIICGHVHLDQESQHHGLTMLTTPSTCFQFSKVSQHHKSLPGPPGLRLVDVKGLVLSTRVLHLHHASDTDV